MYMQLPMLKSKPQRVRELQTQHTKLLKLVDNSCLGLPSRKRLLPPTSILYCVQLDPSVTDTWNEFQIDEFANRCQWERNVRSDFIYGVKPRKDTFKYPNPYLELEPSVSKIVRSPLVDAKVDRTNKAVSPISSRPHSRSPTPAPGTDKRGGRPLSTVKELPKNTSWFQLPGKKKILGIKGSPKKGSERSTSAETPSTTPPDQIFGTTDAKDDGGQTDGSTLDKLFHAAWSTGQFTTPEDSDRRVNWGSHDASGVVKDFPVSSSSDDNPDEKKCGVEPELDHLGMRLDTSLVLETPPPQVETREERIAREQARIRERYVPIRMFDMYHRRNGMGPGVEDNEY